jgi:tetratricopeptide (TPR) repeat protein
MKVIFSLLFLLFFADCFSQTYFPELSPKGLIKQHVGQTTIEINYERPAARGRNVIGQLVPYNKLWRTGAGNCTKIKFNQPVVIGGTKINAGTFSLLTIPNPTEWTIIINSDTTLYGTSSYNQNKDLLRFNVKPERTSRFYESLTIDLDVIPNNAELYISWERTQIHFTIGTEIDKRVTEYITQTLLTNKSSDSDEYATAADYYFYLDKELDKALVLINNAISKKSELWYFRLKIDILEKQRKYQEAIEVSNLAIEFIQNNADWDSQTKQQSVAEYNQRIEGFKKRKTK